MLLVGLATACGDDGGSDESAADATLQLLDYLRPDQAGRQWEILHPKHQEVASRDEFLRCAEAASRFFSTAEVIQLSETTLPIRYLGDVDATALTLQLTIRGVEFEQSWRFTTHLVVLDGSWRWTMSDNDLDAFEAGRCPDPRSLSPPSRT